LFHNHAALKSPSFSRAADDAAGEKSTVASHIAKNIPQLSECGYWALHALPGRPPPIFGRISRRFCSVFRNLRNGDNNDLPPFCQHFFPEFAHFSGPAARAARKALPRKGRRAVSAS
jgi:hypothetical protein